MRIYADCRELISEMFRDVHEMGIITTPKSYQNKNIEGDDNFITKELESYVYKLQSLANVGDLFRFEGTQEWADAEFEERVAYNFINPGEAWKNRKGTWEQFLNSSGMFDYTYNQRINPRLALPRIVKELEENPDTRQCWLPIFQPGDVRYMRGSKRIPCSLGYYFKVNDGVLTMTYIQRSADAVAHLGNDIYLAWRMMEYVSEKANLKPGGIIHHIFSLHAYKKDWETLAKGIS